MKVMGIIFTNDAKVGELTSKRSIASIPFAGRYRQVDFPLTNLACAGISHIAIISRYNYQSLMDHIGDGEEWGLELGEGGLQYITPYANSETHSYRGKLESLNNAMSFLEYDEEDEYVVMTDASVISNIDLNKVIDAHIKSGKDVTVVVKEGIANAKKVLDLAVTLDEKGEINDMVVDYAAAPKFLASMDIFVTSKKWLTATVHELVARNKFHMDRDLVLGGWQAGKVSVNAYVFDGVAMYNDSVEEYFQNTLALVGSSATFQNVFFGAHHIYTKVRDRVPTYYGEGNKIDSCLVADGCMLEGHAKNSVLFRQVTLGKGAEVENCIIMNDSVVGEGAVLKNVILDKNVTVSAGAQLIGTAANPIVIKRGGTV